MITVDKADVLNYNPKSLIEQSSGVNWIPSSLNCHFYIAYY